MPVMAQTQGWHALWSKFLVPGVAVLMAVIDELARLGGYVTSDNQCPRLRYVISKFQLAVFLLLMPGLSHHHYF